MRKKHRSTESDEPLSEGRVEYLEAARQRVRNRRIRRTAVLLVLLTAVVLFATGIAGSSVAALKDLTDTARIALLPGSGWPQQTGVAELEQMAPLTGSFVELGDEGCVVWSRTGKKLNSIQSGYARPALAAGKTLQPLRKRAAGGEPHPEPLHQAAGKQHFPLRHVGQRHAGCGHGGPDQYGKAAGIQPLHGAAAQLEHDLQRRHPPADGLFPRQPEAGGGRAAAGQSPRPEGGRGQPSPSAGDR